jgi:hypothetical protein
MVASMNPDEHIKWCKCQNKYYILTFVYFMNFEIFYRTYFNGLSITFLVLDEVWEDRLGLHISSQPRPNKRNTPIPMAWRVARYRQGGVSMLGGTSQQVLF